MLRSTRKMLLKVIVPLLLVSCVTSALAQTRDDFPVVPASDFHLPFDGSAMPGMAYTKDGSAAPEYVEGRTGQALLIRDRSVVAVPVNIDPDDHPQLTVTAWIKISANADLNPFLFSGGGGGLPQLKLEDRRLTARAGDHSQQLALQIPFEEWVFVAAVWDFDAGSLLLKTSLEDPGVQAAALSAMDVDRHNSRGPPGGSRDERRPYVFIGASHFGNFGYPARGVAFDEVRISRRALTGAELDGLELGVQPVGSATPDTAAEACDCEVPGDTDSRACEAPGDCGRGSYCAMDQTCHPNQHAPMVIRPSADLVDPTVEVQAPSYLQCGADDDCARADDQCFDVVLDSADTEGAMCTRMCSSDDDCGGSFQDQGLCLRLDRYPAMCYQRCVDESDCTPSKACITVALASGMIESVCVPSG